MGKRGIRMEKKSYIMMNSILLLEMENIGLDGCSEMVKHTNQCKKSKCNSDGITCLFTTYKGVSNA